MLLSVTFEEITSILKNKYKLNVRLTGAGDGKVHVTYDAGGFLGELSMDVGMSTGGVKNELILSLSSQVVGLNKVFEGLLLFIDSKLPYNAMSVMPDRKTKLSLTKIPQLASVFNMVSLTGVTISNTKIEISVGVN